jgi:hypothetical protein
MLTIIVTLKMHEKHDMITGEYEMELLYTVLSQSHTGTQRTFLKLILQ